jgi:hypothetical protein
LQLFNRGEQLLGVDVFISPCMSGEEGAAALARRERLAERLIVVLVRRPGQRA